jgi:quercetin dioxygenase-like cupin family protein
MGVRSMNDLILKQFDQPDVVRKFEKGKFEIVSAGGVTVGRATYEPGWKWTEHVKPLSGTDLCEVEHVGLVISGRAKVLMRDGTETEMKPGDFFYVAPGHDSWVVGDEQYVSLHFKGVEAYAK